MLAGRCWRRTGESAIDLLENSPKIDVLETDIQLAGDLSGWDVAEAFRAAIPEVPVIYASGNLADRSRAVTNSLFFSKPYRASAIIEASGSAELTEHKKKPRPKPGRLRLLSRT